MPLEASLPERFWRDAIATAVYILNCCLTKAPTGKTPFEAWFARWQNLAHLCCFGCDAYLHVPDAQRTKVKPKALLGTFLGYMPNTRKQWRLWDGNQQKIVIGSNVIFNENGFGNRWPEDPKILEDYSEDQTDEQNPPAAPRDRPVVETLARSATAPLLMPATSPPASSQNSQHPEEAPERVADSRLKSLSTSTQDLDHITPTFLRSAVEYDDTIMLAPLAGSNTASGELNGAGSAIAKTSRAFAARFDNEL